MSSTTMSMMLGRCACWAEAIAGNKAGKAVKLQFESSLGEDFRLQTNEEMLKRVVGLLFDNAIKYTKQGSITLKASADDEQVTLTVEDTGTGIPKEKQSAVFERFVKLNDFVQGTGLGLSICKAIVDKAGGRIGVSSEGEGHGSTFWFWIPC